MSDLLKLGQSRKKDDPGTWFSLVKRPGTGFVFWPDADDEEFREMLDIHPDQNIPRVRVRHLENPKRNEYMRTQFKKYRRLGRNLPSELEDKIIRESIAHAVLLDWRHIALPDGTVPEEYTPEIGSDALKDREFLDVVTEMAADTQAHHEAALSEEVESLGETSAGT